MGKSRVTLNGKQVAEHFGGYLPIHVEVTGVLKEGENLLEVWCDNSNDSSYPPGKAQDVLDFTYFGGIYRDAYLVETGEAYVSDTDKGGVRITSNLGADGTWTVRADVTLGGDVEGATATVSYDGRAASPLAAESGAVTTTFHPDSPALWTPETPNLHWLRVDVKKGGRLTDSVRVRFGIRDFKATLNGLVLNGKPFKPDETKFDYEAQHRIGAAARKKARKGTENPNSFIAELPDGSKTVLLPSMRLAKIVMALDTEGLAPVADGGDLVAPASGELTFTPGLPDVKTSSSRTTDDARLREVERQQHDFETARPR